jgi:UrcA family protein
METLEGAPLMRTKTRVILLAFLAVAVNSVAMADGSVNVKSETVRFDDLRLISTVGAAVLYARLRGAAERVCGGPAESAQIAEQRRYRSCVDDALAKAVADVNHPVLNTYVASKRGAPAPSNATTTAATTSVSIIAKAR